MNSIFKMDGPVFTMINKIADTVILSVLWVIFSLPIVTIGASSAALYHTTHKAILKSEGYVFSTFFKSFKTNLKQGITLFLLCIPISIFAFVSFKFAESFSSGHILGYLYYGVTIFVSFILLIMITHMFPILSRFYMKTIDLLKTSIALAITRIGFTLLLLVIFVICITCVYLIPGSIFILPVCYSIAAERLLEPGFEKMIDITSKATSAPA